MLEHGGGLRAAALHYGIPLAEWLDLSTGINPCCWHTDQAVPLACWQRLPEEGDGLEAAAAAYYGSEALLPVAGSQAAIQTLPRLQSPARVGVIAPGYAEHAAAWRQWGHEVVPLAADAIEGALDSLQVLVVINPCNPTGVTFARTQLQRWQRRLAARGGWLVVDEAFGDTNPEQGLINAAPCEGLIVLRSLGKFFGLAGVRVGFVHAPATILTSLRELLGPWSIGGPARWIATQALLDLGWQQQQRHALHQAGQRLAALVEQAGFPHHGGSALFRWFETPHAEYMQQQLAQQGIWVRRFESPASLRLGLPGRECEWQRLERALLQLELQRAVA